MSKYADDAKVNARKNILQAIACGAPTSEIKFPPSPPLIEPSPDDIARDSKLRVMQSVKAFQKEGPPPIAKPRRSPHSSPNHSRVASPSGQKPTPQRPPPPKLTTTNHALHVNTQEEKQTTPPTSPMHTRPMEQLRPDKPKPPTRRRKKFQTPEDATDGDTSSNRLSDFDNIPGLNEPDNEHHDKQVKQVNDVHEPSTVKSTNENAQEQSGYPEEPWEVIQGIAITNEMLHDKLVKQVSLDPPDSPHHSERLHDNLVKLDPPDSAHQSESPEANKLSQQDYQLSESITNETFEEAVRALSIKRKKKPPPLRPAPYTEKTPPLPPKKRKTVHIKDQSGVKDWNQIAEEASSAVASRSKGYEEEAGQDEIEEGEEVTEHLYECIDPKDLKSHPENVYLHKNPSETSLDSEENGVSGPLSGEVHINRASTMGTVERIINRGRNSLRSRPLSTASSNSICSKDLEASFEVIPNSGSNIEDVMTTLRRADEKYQDATIYELIQACSRAMPHVTSTTELPSRLPDFPANEAPRNQVIHELYTTEYTYVKGLEVLVEVFRDGLITVLGDETSRVFANVDNILAFNKGFIALLHNRLREWSPESCVGEIFIGMFTQSHKSMYAIYCSNYDTAEMLVNKLKKRKEFEQQLQTCLMNGRVVPGLTLQAYLITPVQRVPRYILLLKDIIKRTPEAHADYKNLTKALQIMSELAHYIDAQVSESQTKKTLESLKNKVHGLADLDSPDRSLVKDGQVYFKNIKKLYQCILFNDLLVLAHGDSKQSRVELQLDLEAVWMEDLEDLDPHTSNEDAIEVHTPERPYTIYTQSRNEKRLWLSKLKDTIYHHLQQQDKCVPSAESIADARYASFIYGDERVYSGNYVGAKCHGKGTMTWPNKTVYVGDWVDDERCGEGEFTYNTGDVYRGKWSEDKQNGMGELQFASNDIYRGYWKDGLKHGNGKILYANGDVFEGHFVNGSIEGEGKLKCVEGVEYTGDWKHSQRHGSGRLKTTTGKIYKGEFHYNVIHGQGIMVYPNKDKYDGRWKNGMRHGQGKLISKLEGTYEGTWDEDLRHGFGKLRYPNKDHYEGQWEHNRRHGKGKMLFSAGRSYEGEFTNDMIHGEGQMTYNKDQTSKYEGSWISGLRHGSGAMVFEDKSSYNGDWQFGLRHGQGEYVTGDGSVYRGQWVNDKSHGKGTLSIPTASYSYNGDWISGKREGRGEEHSQYGQYKGAWKADMKHGYGEERTLVGTIFEGTWEKSRKHGRGVRKMIFGTVEEQGWKSGQLVSDPSRMTAIELPFLNRNDL